jgi:LacI family transcriptional regulator
MPVVMFDRVTNEILCDKVIIDDKMLMKCKSLIDKGRKKIALVTTVDYVSVGKLRTDGYIKALLDNDIPFNENLIIKIEDVDLRNNNWTILQDKAIDAVLR